MAGRGERGVSRVLDKLEASVNSGQYYEAHQMYRTLYFRYLSLNKYPDLLDLLYKGATLLLHRDQQGSGADLAVLLIDVLNKSETKPCPEWIEKIATIFQIMSPSIPEREAFLTVSVKWSMDSNRKGHPLLHKRIAEIFWKEKKFSAAHRHFLHSNDGSTYADMLIELHTTQGLKSEIDLFIAQAVLQCLCLRNLQMALEAFNKYTGTHPTIKNDKGPPFLLPLLNFLWFLMKAVEQKHVIQFKILRTCYAITIKRDPNYSVYLDTIGRLWFGIEIPQGNKNSNSILGGLLNSLIGNIDTSEDEGDGTEPRSTATPDLD